MQDRWMRTQVFDIAATPQGGSDLNISPKCNEGKRLASLTSSPRYDAGTPKGVLMMEVHKTYNEVIDYLHENHL